MSIPEIRRPPSGPSPEFSNFLTPYLLQLLNTHTRTHKRAQFLPSTVLQNKELSPVSNYLDHWSQRPKTALRSQTLCCQVVCGSVWPQLGRASFVFLIWFKMNTKIHQRPTAQQVFLHPHPFSDKQTPHVWTLYEDLAPKNE